MSLRFLIFATGRHCWWSRLTVLLCAIAASLSASFEVRTYYDLQIPSEYPKHYIPVALDNIIASSIPIWPRWTLDENIYAFVVSMGGRAFHGDSVNDERALTHILKNLRDSINSMNATTYVISPSVPYNAMGSSTDIGHKEKGLPHVVIPLLLDGDASLVTHVYDAFSTSKNQEDKLQATTRQFLERQLHMNLGTLNKKSTSSPALQHFQKLLLSQIRLATERRLGSKEIFETAMRRVQIQNLSPAKGATCTMEQINKDANERVAAFEMKKTHVPKNSMSILGKYYVFQNRVDVFVINLMSSPYRRVYIQGELKRSGIPLNNVHYTPAVDGMMVPLDNLKHVLKDSNTTIIHQGAIGCALSHITVWRNIVKLGLPHSLVLEDDAVLLPNAHQHIKDGLRSMYNSAANRWDIIITDFGSSPYVGLESMRQHGTPQDCVQSFYNSNDFGMKKQLLIDITGSSCAHFNSVSYIVSYGGAKRLLKNLIPFNRPVDIEILRLIESGVLRAYVLLPFVSGQVLQERKRGSDMIERFITMQHGEAVYTFNSVEEQNCLNERCVLRVYNKN